jgi:hypothetical protein
MQETCAVPRIQAEFRRGGFRVNLSVEPARMEFSEVQPRDSKAFREIRRISYPLENLCRRTQMMSSGIICERFLELFSIETSHPGIREFDNCEVFDK